MTSSASLSTSDVAVLPCRLPNNYCEISKNVRQPNPQNINVYKYASKSLDSNSKMLQSQSSSYLKNRIPASYAVHYNTPARQRITALGSMTENNLKNNYQAHEEQYYNIQRQNPISTHNKIYPNKNKEDFYSFSKTNSIPNHYIMNNNKMNNRYIVHPPAHLLNVASASYYDEQLHSLPTPIPHINNESQSFSNQMNAATMNSTPAQADFGNAAKFATTPAPGRYLARNHRKNTAPIPVTRISSAAIINRNDRNTSTNDRNSTNDGNKNVNNIKRITFSLKNGNGNGNSEKFILYDYFQPIKFLGKGAYAVVIAATDMRTNSEVAIKKNKGVFNALSDAKRILREIKLMLHFEHENIMPLISVIPPEIRNRENFEDVYLLMPRMETTLAKVIHSKQVLTEKHKQYFIFQLLRGLKYIHSAGVIHRDLKPENILINGSDCKLRISDFGLSRGVLKNGNEHQELTEYVVTRWYRAPEIMCSSRQYDEGVDVWGLGCIMSELYLRKPIFPGSNHIEQLRLIFSYLGTPVDCDWIKTSDARRWVGGLQKNSGQNFRKVFPEANGKACDLIRCMLCMNPNRRITVQQALEHPWINPLYRTAISSLRKAKTRALKKINMLTHEITDDEIEIQMDVCREKFNLEFEFERQINTIFGVRHMMYEELHAFARKREMKTRRIKKHLYEQSRVQTQVNNEYEGNGNVDKVNGIRTPIYVNLNKNYK